jgi:carbon monoxide dehydrogenase subunit G
MKAIQVSETIHADKKRVFEAMSNFEIAASVVSGIQKTEMLTPGPVGVGTRFKETRIMMKREATETMEVTVFKPFDTYTLEAESCGCHYTSVMTLRDLGGGNTEVTMSFRGVAKTFMAKLMMPLGYLMQGMLKKLLLKDISDIKAHLESEPVADAKNSSAT